MSPPTKREAPPGKQGQSQSGSPKGTGNKANGREPADPTVVAVREAILAARDADVAGTDSNHLCPAHDDRSESLTVRAKGGRQALVRCHAHCENEEVLAACGLTMADLYGKPDPAPPVAGDDVPEATTEATVFAWTYRLRHDLTRLRWLQVHRGLTLSTASAHEIGWDGSRYTIPVRDEAGRIVNVRRYNRDSTPKIKNTAGFGAGRIYPVDVLDHHDEVLLCESELDALLANQHGIPAVTGTSGAKTFKPEWAEKFTGKVVRIAYDCDDDGRAGAEKAARHLYPHARAVYVADLGLSDKEDVTDWFVTYGKSAEDLRRLLADAPSWSPPAGQEDWTPDFADKVEQRLANLRIDKTARQQLADEEWEQRFDPPPSTLTLADELAIEDEPLTYTVEQLHPLGGNTLLTAQFKAGKTTLGINLLRSLLDDQPFLAAFPVTVPEGRVAFWNYEVDDRQFRAWLRKAGIQNLDRGSVLNVRGYRMPLWTPQGEGEAIRWLAERDVSVWIVDPFARAFRGAGKENDNDDVGRFLEALDIIKHKAGVTDLFLNSHTGRQQHEEGAEHVRGATVLDDWPDVRWIMTKDKDGGRYFRADGRDVLIPEQGLDFSPQTLTLRLNGASRADARLDAATTEAAEVVARSPGMGVMGLRKAMRGDTNYKDKGIHNAVLLGLVEVRDEARGKKAHYPVSREKVRVNKGGGDQ